jgi:hypothetical protein
LADATLEAPVVEPLEAPDAPEQAPAADAAPKKDKKEKKDEKDKKGKGKEKKAAEPASADGPSVAAHPRAARAVATAKGWGGVIGFAAGGYLSLPTHTLADAGLRALIAGVVCYVAGWAGAVFVWRRLVVLEIKAREQHLLEMLKARSAGQQTSQPAGGARPGSPI